MEIIPIIEVVTVTTESTTEGVLKNLAKFTEKQFSAVILWNGKAMWEKASGRSVTAEIGYMFIFWGAS